MKYAIVLMLMLSAFRSPKGESGNDGASIVGPQGAPGQSIVGPVGPAGAPGLNGTNGIDATPVTIVQFCSNVTPTYPSVFPEYGICLGGQLYGVYSANGGFLALLPPGEYNSNAIGS